MKAIEPIRKDGLIKEKVKVINLYNNLMDKQKVLKIAADLKQPLNKITDLPHHQNKDKVLVSKLQIKLHLELRIQELKDLSTEVHREEDL